MSKPLAKHTPGWKRRPARAPTTKAEIVIRDLYMKPLFILQIYGITGADLCVISEDPQFNGGDIVAAALRKRGIDPDSVMFSLWDVKL